MYRDSKKACNVKSEPKSLEENTIKDESNTIKLESTFVKDSVSVNKVANSRKSVKSIGARKINSISAQCHKCCKTFANKYVLKTHINSPNRCSPKEAKPPQDFVPCATCGKDKKAESFLRHEKLCRMSEDERAAYNETLKVKCEKCDKILSHKGRLRRRENCSQ